MPRPVPVYPPLRGLWELYFPAPDLYQSAVFGVFRLQVLAACSILPVGADS